VWTGDIDICGGETGTGLWRRAGSDRLLSVLPEENHPIGNLDFSRVLGRVEDRTGSRSRERSVVEDFYILYEEVFTG